MEELIKKAEVLIEALPYIRRFKKKIAVIKYGGSILGEEGIRKNVLEDIIFLNLVGIKTILIHGGGPNISERMRMEGKKTEFVQGMRVTDEETLQVVSEELEKLNTLIVEEITGLGGKALGLNGKDNNLIQAKKKEAKVDLGLVGEVVGINKEFLIKELKEDNILVICPMGLGLDKKVYNVNADEAASWIAASLLAEKLIILTNIKGVIRNPDDPNTFISTLNIREAGNLINDKVIQEGMIPKVEACIRAIKQGVRKAHIIDARTPHALLLEIFTDKGIGTEIVR